MSSSIIISAVFNVHWNTSHQVSPVPMAGLVPLQSPALDQALRAAINDLASKSKLAPESVQVVSVKYHSDMKGRVVTCGK